MRDVKPLLITLVHVLRAPSWAAISARCEAGAGRLLSRCDACCRSSAALAAAETPANAGTHDGSPPAPLRRRTAQGDGHPRDEVWSWRSDRTAGHNPWWRAELCSSGCLWGVRHLLRLRQLLSLPPARLEPGPSGRLAQGRLQRLLRRLHPRADPSVPTAPTACPNGAQAAAGLATHCSGSSAELGAALPTVRPRQHLPTVQPRQHLPAVRPRSVCAPSTTPIPLCPPIQAVSGERAPHVRREPRAARALRG